jgi:hypothetical protein
MAILIQLVGITIHSCIRSMINGCHCDGLMISSTNFKTEPEKDVIVLCANIFEFFAIVLTTSNADIFYWLQWTTTCSRHRVKIPVLDLLIIREKVPTSCARNHCPVDCLIACFPCVICESEKCRLFDCLLSLWDLWIWESPLQCPDRR